MRLPPDRAPFVGPDASAYRDAISRRAALASALAVGASAVACSAVAPNTTIAQAPATAAPAPGRTFAMKKSINSWAFPYPDKWTLRQCLQTARDAGFDGIELNFDLDSELSPKSGTPEFTAIRKMADEIGIAVSGLCSFLFWPYPLVSNDPVKRQKGQELAGLMCQAAHDLGTDNLLVVPGAVHIPWRTDHEPVRNDVCDQRARESVGKMIAQAEKLKVSLNMENIFFNGFLMTPMEMNAFVDSFGSENVRVHFDTGNIMEYQFPEHWIQLCGKRIKNVHLKEYTKKGTDHSLEAFRPLLDGTTNWPAVLDSFAANDYTGYLTFEYFHPYLHHPEALVYQTSDSLDRMLGRKPWSFATDT